MWVDELNASGDLVSLSEGARRLTVRRGATSGNWRVRRFTRTPRPSEVSAARPDELFWLPSMTPALRTRLRALDVSWVTDLGEVHIDLPWGAFHHRPASESADPVLVPPGYIELSPGAAAVLQFLLEHPFPAPQTRIASAVGLSQPRVSQVMPELRSAGLVERCAGGYLATDPGEGFAILRFRPQTAATVAVGWYSVESPANQLTAVRQRAAGAGAEVRLCGDWAADLLAPWRQPGRIVVHADSTLDLDGATFVPSPLETATLELRVEPIRPSWQPAAEIIAAMTDRDVDSPVAPVTEIAREISAAGGSDAEQAVDELRTRWLRARKAVGGRAAGQ